MSANQPAVVTSAPRRSDLVLDLMTPSDVPADMLNMLKTRRLPYRTTWIADSATLQKLAVKGCNHTHAMGGAENQLQLTVA